jgi:hypothetical protein
MTRISIAGLALIGLAACTGATPKNATPGTSAPAATAHVKSVARPVATRSQAGRKPQRQLAVRPNTTSLDRNPLTNH